VLVRAGLANKAQLARIHRILDKMTEERPQFNNADREIMRNLFNRMVDIISNNKQIFQKTRQAVKEELKEGVLDTADIKVKAHRIKIGDVAHDNEVKEEFDLVESPIDFENDPPFVLVLKRRAIRMYPDRTKVALYYSKTLDKHFSVPYGNPISAVVQAEETQMEEAVMDKLYKIVSGKQAQTVKFANGQTRKVDHYTASAITQVHNALNEENKKKFADMVHKSPAHLVKASDFAFRRAK
jgi:hypothetical protein